ncbi:MAG: hypothetical protein EPO42_02370 [Gallionellaceae bacterium]|nr:MAG: hypothetical protein EPO42_02370 [Gallionellaceae bacterium]
MLLLHKRPTYLLHLLWLCCLAVCAATAWLALQPPWLGVQLAGIEGKVRVVEAFLQQIPEGAEVKRLISATGTSIDLLATDMVENADYFPSYAKKDEFFARQSALYAMLYAGEVSIVWNANEGAEHTTSIKPRQRPLASLSAIFWFQLAVVSTAFMIACWVWLMRPQDWGARMFALTGLSLLMGGITGVLMSERALALDGAWFSTLDNANSLSAHFFGSSIVALILCYPRQLVAPRTLWWLPILCIPGWLAYSFHLLPTPSETMIAISILVSLAFIGGGVQWRLTRGQPLERAALRWFLLSVLLAAALFTFTNVAPTMFDKPPLLPVGYSIGFFLIMYVGIALGLRRYRLFDMDEWAYRVFLWVAGATSVIALDALLIFTGVTEGASLGISLLLCGWLYFPFRQWLWQRIVSRQAPNFESLLPEISTIAFTASATEQQAHWEALLKRVFDPLEIRADGDSGSGLHEEGLGMRVPGCGKIPVYALRYAGRGARLFSTRDAVFAASLSQLLEQVMSGRSGYEQGVAQERLRIGRDLHDNIGARLLKLIHHLRGTPDAEVARDAMKDLRTAIASMDTHPVPLGNALADWRAEAGSRCEAAGCRLHWRQSDSLPAVELAPRSKAMLESTMREIITNALKHAAPSYVKVDVAADAARLRASVENDGAIADPLTWKDGYGLRNMRGRLEELGGSLSIAAGENEVKLILEVPLL